MRYTMIAIPNMDKPKNCAECPISALSEFSGIVCKLNRNNNKNNCPLIEIIKCKDCKHSKNCIYPAKWNWCPDGERRTE